MEVYPHNVLPCPQVLGHREAVGNKHIVRAAQLFAVEVDIRIGIQAFKHQFSSSRNPVQIKRPGIFPIPILDPLTLLCIVPVIEVLGNAASHQVCVNTPGNPAGKGKLFFPLTGYARSLPFAAQ
jgi:hypothetical protein